jgi:hypothetical protein
MTRFATLVEGGAIVALIDVLRFDDTLFRMLGQNLEALTAERSCRWQATATAQFCFRRCACPARCFPR